MLKESCRFIQQNNLLKKKEDLECTCIEGEVDHGNNEGPKKVDKDSTTFSEALQKNFIFKKTKCQLLPGSEKP